MQNFKIYSWNIAKAENPTVLWACSQSEFVRGHSKPHPNIMGQTGILGLVISGSR